jgi:ribosomal protein L20
LIFKAAKTTKKKKKKILKKAEGEKISRREDEEARTNWAHQHVLRASQSISRDVAGAKTF